MEPRVIDPDRLVAEVMAARERVRAKLPDIDDNELILILQNLFRPLGTGRRFFLRDLGGGVYVP